MGPCASLARVLRGVPLEYRWGAPRVHQGAPGSRRTRASFFPGLRRFTPAEVPPELPRVPRGPEDPPNHGTATAVLAPHSDTSTECLAATAQCASKLGVQVSLWACKIHNYKLSRFSGGIPVMHHRSQSFLGIPKRWGARASRVGGNVLSTNRVPFAFESVDPAAVPINHQTHWRNPECICLSSACFKHTNRDTTRVTSPDTNRDTCHDTNGDTNRDTSRDADLEQAALSSRTHFRCKGSVRLIFSHTASHVHTHARTHDTTRHDTTRTHGHGHGHGLRSTTPRLVVTIKEPFPSTSD
jgi:hypothetical protein